MNSLLALASLALLAGPPKVRPEPFTKEAEIFAVSRADLTLRPVALTEVIEALTTWRKVTASQDGNFHHKFAATGSVTLRGGLTHLWSIQKGYAGRVTDPWGRITYLLHPSLKAEQEPNR